MKRILSVVLPLFAALTLQAQIHQPVKWNIHIEDTPTAEKSIVFTASIEKGWHLYDMNLPDGGPVSTSFTFEKVKGAELSGEPVADAKPKVVYDEQFGMDLRWFPDAVTFTQKVRVTDAKKFRIEGEVEYMACNDETCLPPEREGFVFDAKNTALTLPPSGSGEEKALLCA